MTDTQHSKLLTSEYILGMPLWSKTHNLITCQYHHVGMVYLAEWRNWQKQQNHHLQIMDRLRTPTSS